MKRYILDGQYGALLAANGIDVLEVLRESRLPENLFDSATPSMREEDYYRFFSAMGENAELAIRLATSQGVEQFSPPIYGAYCSENGQQFLERLATYKRLVGPLVFALTEDSAGTTLEIRAHSADSQVPLFLILCEFLFLVHAMRQATGERIEPTQIQMRGRIQGDTENYFGVPISNGATDEIRFSDNDLALPFKSAQPSMWDYLEPELSRRLAQVRENPTMQSQVREVLSNLLISGICDEQNVADELGISKRTLQRRLRAENTTYQLELRTVRESLATKYLQDSELSCAEISNLLGYQELNSFLRAFADWTGMSVSEFRRRRCVPLQEME